MNPTSIRLAYFDCFSGIAGDMTLGALVDAGLDLGDLVGALEQVPLEGWSVDARSVVREGLRGTDLRVAYLGQEEGPAIPDPGGELPPSTDDAQHRAWGHDHHHDHHRSYVEVVRIIEAAQLPPAVRTRALDAFQVLAEAEGRIHGLPVEEVHFHELGAVDSIIDIVGVSFGLWKLGIEVVESAPPPLGRGFVRCAHGRMPLPAPVTLEILKGVLVRSDPLERELVTPTGAAFIKAWTTRVGPLPDMVIESVGFGFGDAQFPDRPNALRLLMGRRPSCDPQLWVLESNLDDLHPELAGYLLGRTFEVGALDAWFTPIQMKKNRPGVTVSALVDAERAPVVEDLFLRESSSLGVRRYPVERNHLERRSVTVETPFGPVPVKIAFRGRETLNVAPEHDVCARLARAASVPLKQVYQQAIASYFNAHVPGA